MGGSVVTVPPPSASTDINPLAAALYYASQGWPVFPLHTPVAEGGCSCRKTACKDVGKHPCTRHGLKDASTDTDIITGWWEKWPSANVGLRTGAESNLVVLDADAGTGGRETLAQLEAACGPLPPTLMVETGGGGVHYYFCHPGTRVTTNAGTLGPGLDVRGDGGYVVAPPSLHRNGRRYQWSPGTRDGLSPAPLPPWILGGVVRPVRSGPHLLDEAPIPEGQRNTTLTSLAGSLRRVGLSEAAMLAALGVMNEERCDPPLDEREVAKIAQSIARYPVESGGVPARRQGSTSEITQAQKRADDLQAILSAMLAVIENPYLKKEAVVALRIITLLESFHAKASSTDGFYRLSDNDIGDVWHRDKPIVTRSSITRAKKQLRAWELFQIETRPGSRLENVVHPETGEITSRRVPIKETWIRRDRPMLDKLQQLAAFVPSPSAAGGATEPTDEQSAMQQAPEEILVLDEHADAQILDTAILSPMRQIDADTYVTTPGGVVAPSCVRLRHQQGRCQICLTR